MPRFQPQCGDAVPGVSSVMSFCIATARSSRHVWSGTLPLLYFGTSTLPQTGYPTRGSSSIGGDPRIDGPCLPGYRCYALTIVKSASTLKDVASYEIQVDGTAELWLKSLADFDAYSSSQATKRLRDYGATFIGREIDFITQGKGHHLVSPMTAAGPCSVQPGLSTVQSIRLI
jgi:hypothetical protein